MCWERKCYVLPDTATGEPPSITSFQAERLRKLQESTGSARVTQRRLAWMYEAPTINKAGTEESADTTKSSASASNSGRGSGGAAGDRRSASASSAAAASSSASSRATTSRCVHVCEPAVSTMRAIACTAHIALLPLCVNRAPAEAAAAASSKAPPAWMAQQASSAELFQRRLQDPLFAIK